jgi:GDPmannose 4,6-dehydratase
MKKALIFGLSGQDGSYLARLLIEKNYFVYGTTRRKKKNIINFKKLEIKKKNYKIFTINLNNYKEVKKIIKFCNCTEIYYLSGVSSVFYSNLHPLKCVEDNTKGIFNILESCRELKIKARIYNAASSECFGNIKNRIDEKTSFNPLSPYGLSKTINYYIANHYKKNFKLYVSTGFSFNHDSPLRPKEYVLKKIINFCKSKNSKYKKLRLGNVDISRDWGWAPEHVKFIYKILRLSKPNDFVIGTGKSYILRKLIITLFKKYNLDFKNNIDFCKKNFRKNDIIKNCSNPNKLKRFFKNYPKTSVKTILDKLIENKYY